MWLPLDPAGCSISEVVSFGLARSVLAERLWLPLDPAGVLLYRSFQCVALSPHVFLFCFVPFRSWFLLAFQEVAL